MSKTPKGAEKPREPGAKQSKKMAEAAAQPSHAVRETVESIVIAFVLAFLFRTFEAEAFVIPTGSMAPTLMGRHKDVDCPKCGHRFRVTASEEGDDADAIRSEIAKTEMNIQAATNTSSQFYIENPQKRQQFVYEQQHRIEQLYAQIQGLAIVAGVCPICHYAMPMAPGLQAADADEQAKAKKQPTFNGDRILVNKYLYTVAEPKRWDVVVFHFPGDAEINYIKRLVGLPGETLRVYEGDLFVGPPDAKSQEDFTISRKPADKVLAVRQIVHDTDYDPAELYNAGWPLRWRAESPTGADGWQTAAQADGSIVRQKFTVDRTHGGDAWLRYHHMVPNYEVWRQLDALRKTAAAGTPAKFSDADKSEWRPELIMDFNAYNTRVQMGDANRNLWPPEWKLGMHWVGDLMLEADVEVADTKGELVLDLVEAGKHFSARIELATGKATLGIADVTDYAPTATTPLSKPGNYHVAFANVDDQLLLWVGGKLVEFDKDTAYDAVKVFGTRNLKPMTSAADRGDLAPAGIGASGSKLTVTRLQLWRDIYYIADSAARRRSEGGGPVISDYVQPSESLVARLRSDPTSWDEFLRRRHVEFPLGTDQFFVMGDNSPESSDARLWSEGSTRSGGQPGGAYLERKLLIGKAVCVYWPHAWYTIPFTPLPAWPNFWDMRLVR